MPRNTERRVIFWLSEKHYQKFMLAYPIPQRNEYAKQAFQDWIDNGGVVSKGEPPKEKETKEKALNARSSKVLLESWKLARAEGFSPEQFSQLIQGNTEVFSEMASGTLAYDTSPNVEPKAAPSKLVRLDGALKCMRCEMVYPATNPPQAQLDNFRYHMESVHGGFSVEERRLMIEAWNQIIPTNKIETEKEKASEEWTNDQPEPWEGVKQ